MPHRKPRTIRWRTPEARFWKYVNISDHTECWEWVGNCQPVTNHPELLGYGQLRVEPCDLVLAHRYSWMLHFGPIPRGLCVLHVCDNRPCVRPDHLFLGTKEDNTQDAMQKGRMILHPENLALSPNHHKKRSLP